MDPCTVHQWPPISQSESPLGIQCLFMEEHTTYEVIFPKIMNLNLIKSVDSTSNLQEMQRRQEHVELYHKDANSKIQTVGNSSTNSKKKKRERWRENLQIKRQQEQNPITMCLSYLDLDLNKTAGEKRHLLDHQKSEY